jgi:hypothetical protein
VDGNVLASFTQPSSIISLTISGSETKLEAQVSSQSLCLIEHCPGDNFANVKSERTATLRNELVTRKEDLMSLEKKAQENMAKMIDLNESDSEDLLGLMGMASKHKARIREIEEMDEMTISYHSWSGVRVQLDGGVLCKVKGLHTAVMVCVCFPFADCKREIKFFILSFRFACNIFTFFSVLPCWSRVLP